MLVFILNVSSIEDFSNNWLFYWTSYRNGLLTNNIFSVYIYGQIQHSKNENFPLNIIGITKESLLESDAATSFDFGMDQSQISGLG